MRAGATAAVPTLDTAIDCYQVLLTRVGRRRQKVWLGSRIKMLAETDIHVISLLPPGVRYLSFPPSLFLLDFCLLSLCLFPFPCPTSLCRYLPLLRVASPVQQLTTAIINSMFSCFPSARAICIMFNFNTILLYCLFICMFLSCCVTRTAVCVLVPGTLAFHLLDP